MTAEKLLDRVEKYKELGDGRWVAVCPAHSDRSPSLHITEKADGVVLIHCKAGCGATEVLDALNLNYDDLYPETHYRQESRRRVSQSTADEFVIELWEHDRVLGRVPSRGDKERFRDALRRVSEGNGFVSKVIEEATKIHPA
jgi:hypothetical protein